MQSNSEAHKILRTLLTTQRLAVVATEMQGSPYTSLVAFVASEDLRRIVFFTTRATQKYRNLSTNPAVSVLIDSRTDTVEDFATGSAVTVIGNAAKIPRNAAGPIIERFLQKHPHLETFVKSPSTAVCSVEVNTYYLVTHFQHVIEMDVTQWSSSNPSQP